MIIWLIDSRFKSIILRSNFSFHKFFPDASGNHSNFQSSEENLLSKTIINRKFRRDVRRWITCFSLLSLRTVSQTKIIYFHNDATSWTLFLMYFPYTKSFLFLKEWELGKLFYVNVFLKFVPETCLISINIAPIQR